VTLNKDCFHKVQGDLGKCDRFALVAAVSVLRSFRSPMLLFKIMIRQKRGENFNDFSLVVKNVIRGTRIMFAKKTDEELKRLRKQNKAKPHITDMYYHDIYGNLERTFYAFMIDKLPQARDMWDSNNDKRKKSLIQASYTYFFINTMVGVGSKNDEKIERVHIRFAIIPMEQYVPEPEIILIYPNYISKVIGEVASRRETESGRRYGIQGKGSGGITSSSFQLRNQSGFS